jgi:hypothetical protein
MIRAILSFEEAAKKAMTAGATLEDVVNVESRSLLMRSRLEEGFEERIEKLVNDMVTEISATAEVAD